MDQAAASEVALAEHEALRSWVPAGEAQATGLGEQVEPAQPHEEAEREHHVVHAPAVHVKVGALPGEARQALAENRRWLAACRGAQQDILRDLDCKWAALKHVLVPCMAQAAQDKQKVLRDLDKQWCDLKYTFDLYMDQAAASEVALAEHEALRSWVPEAEDGGGCVQLREEAVVRPAHEDPLAEAASLGDQAQSTQSYVAVEAAHQGPDDSRCMLGLWRAEEGSRLQPDCMRTTAGSGHLAEGEGLGSAASPPSDLPEVRGSGLWEAVAPPTTGGSLAMVANHGGHCRRLRTPACRVRRDCRPTAEGPGARLRSLAAETRPCLTCTPPHHHRWCGGLA